MRTAMGELYAYWSEEDPSPIVQWVEAYRRAVLLAPNGATLGTALDSTRAVGYHWRAENHSMLGREDEAVWAEVRAARLGFE